MANLSNINNKFLVTTGGNVLIGQTGAVGSSILQVTGNSTFAGTVNAQDMRLQSSGTTYLNIGNATTGSASTDGASIGYFTGQTSLQIVQRENDAMIFSTNSDEKMRIDSSGIVRIYAPGGTSEKTYSAAAGLELYSQQSDSGSPYTKTSDIVANGDGTVPSELRIFTKASGSSTPAERMRIDSGGNVGIGAIPPATKLQVANAGEVIVRSSMTAADGFRGGFEADNQHTGGTIWSMFSTNNSDGYFGGGKYVIANESMGGVDANTTAKFVIDGSGNVGIGTNSPNAKLQVNGNIRAENSSFLAGREDASAPAHSFHDDADTGMFNVTSNILGFSTAGTERMRITSQGDVLVAKQSQGLSITGIELSQDLLRVTKSSAAPVEINRKGTDGTIVNFYKETATKGNISITSSAVAYNTSSDYRLKEDLKDFAGLDMVSKIPVYNFKWKTDDNRSYGVMAHELQEVLPQAVSGDKDAEEMQSVDYSKIVPLLVKSIQELTAKVDKLEQECKCKN